MRRNKKIISVVLAITLMLNLSGFEVTAGENTGSGGAVSYDANDGESKAEDIKDTENRKNSGTDSSNISNGIDANKSSDDSTDSVDSVGNAADSKTENSGKSESSNEALQVESSLEIMQTEKTYLSNLKAEATGKDAVKLTWDVEDEDHLISGYEVALYTDENLDESSKVYECTVGKEENQQTAQAEVRGLSAGILYYVTVTAYSPAENSETEKQTEAKAEIIKVLLLSAPVLSASASEGTVTLNWSAVTGALKYEVYQILGTNRTHLATVTGKTTYTHRVSKNNTTYTYVVEATADGADAASSNQVAATPRTVKPGKVSTFTILDGEKCAYLTWSKASNATSYYIYRYNSSKKRWDMIKQTTALTYTNKSLSAGKTYKYRIAAVRTSLGETVRGDTTSTVSVSIKKSPGTKVRTIGYKAVVKSRAPIFTGKSSKKKVKYLKKGTKITTIDYGSGRYQFKLKGKTYWISKDRLRFTASIWTTKDYSTKVKEDFVNKKGYKSSSKYLIWINQYTQRVIIFQGKKGKWKMIRNCRCATGTHLHMTPKGTFKITYKEKGWFYRTTYEKPIVHFKSQNSFHSRIKNYKGGYADATIGRPKSKGCVRLYDADINFIYKKCPKGTTVVSH